VSTTTSAAPDTTGATRPLRPASDAAVFGPDRIDELVECFRVNGFAILRGLLTDDELAAIDDQCAAAQAALGRGELDERHGTTVLVDDDVAGTVEVANYVSYVSDLSPAVKAAITHPTALAAVRAILGDDCWLMDQRQFGFVYQDARPGRESAYTRIGWHADWQSAPHLDLWPSVALTIHLDGTSPANGFLRVVPGSQRWATPTPYRNINDAEIPEGSVECAGWTDEPPPFEMPLAFEPVPGEIAVYAERGDVLLHDAYLWHSAARGTDDTTRRRHVRGHWCTGEPLHSDDGRFVKNAAR
jgi:ectoine hydroxylase-related dioxygenase (phytanoyl-CoA dioxygenase family)